MDNPRFPATLLWTYLAAIFVILGHSTYQAKAPEYIKRFTRLDHILNSNHMSENENRKRLDEANLAELEAKYSSLSLQGNRVFRMLAAIFYSVALASIIIVIGLQMTVILEAMNWN